jgi:flagellar biosynthesis regulator FlaF
MSRSKKRATKQISKSKEMMTLVPAQSMKSRQKVRFVTFVERSGGRFILDEGSGRLLKKKKTITLLSLKDDDELATYLRSQRDLGSLIVLKTSN